MKMDKLDKLLNSPWFVKVIALFLGLMLYTAVNMDNNNQQSPSVLPKTNEDSEALSNVPLEIKYDQDKYAIYNIPETVTVYLEGPSSLITTAKIQNGYEVYANLTKLGPGNHQVQLQYRGFPNKLNVRIEPSYLEVDIQQRVNQIMPVEVDFINEEQVADGHTVEQPIIIPNTVRVSGGQEEVNKIGLVKAIVDLKGVAGPLSINAPVLVYDQNGSKLNLDIEPSVVEVKVPITGPNKAVPFKITRKGELPEGLSIKSFEVNPGEVTIFGPQEVIEQVEFVDNVEVDLSKIDKDTTLEVDIPVPDGVEKINPEKVTVKIDVEMEVEKTLTEIPIQIVGLGEDLIASFDSPEEGVTDIKVFGAEELLNELEKSDINLFVDLSGYSRGIHHIEIGVNGPQNFRWELRQNTAVIEIK